ncbi:MAG: hypothetical protein ACI9OJ_001272 [Myxococcota bacterium]|jgi:hypothetical protein
MRAFLLFVSIVMLGGCKTSDGPIETRFEDCRDLVSNSELQAESLDCFTPYSRGILKRLLEERKSTSGLLTFIQRYEKLLNYDEITVPADIDGTTAILVVGRGRLRETLLFEYDADEDEWYIDALELAEFWRSLDEALEGE